MSNVHLLKIIIAINVYLLMDTGGRFAQNCIAQLCEDANVSADESMVLMLDRDEFGGAIVDSVARNFLL